MKKVLSILIIVAMLIAGICLLTGCGEKENANNGGTSTNGGSQQEEQDETSGVAWPSNQYTNLIPKPEGATIYDEKEVDNNYYVGHSIDLTDWTIEECKAYAEKLKEAGFTIPSSGANSVVVTDTDSTYSFGAENSDGVYVTVGSSYNSGRISIQKNNNE
ncbi:MAG: hypothetical protein Q4G09_04670 [Clostridia bacterium]|nr:hypothetical protein [Clostridia bacterium]